MKKSKKIFFSLFAILFLTAMFFAGVKAHAGQRVDATALELEMANRTESMLDMLIGQDRAVVKIYLTLTEVSSSVSAQEKSGVETLRPLGLPGMMTARPIPSEEGIEAAPPPPEAGGLIPLITSITMTILLDETVSDEKIKLIKELVPQWVGLDYSRGDILEVKRVPWKEVTTVNVAIKQLQLTQKGVVTNMIIVGAIITILIVIIITAIIMHKKKMVATLAEGGAAGAGAAAGAPAEKSASDIKSDVGRIANVLDNMTEQLAKFQQSVAGQGPAPASDKFEKILEDMKEILSKGAGAAAAQAAAPPPTPSGGGGGLASGDAIKVLEGIREILDRQYRGEDALTRPFEFINNLSPPDILRILEGETDELCGQVIAHLNPDKSAQLFSLVPEEKRDKFITAMAQVKETGSEVVDKVKEFLKEKLKTVKLFEGFTPVVGSQALAESLSMASSEMVHSTLEKLKRDNPQLAEETRKKLFLFEDIALLDSKTISVIMGEIDKEQLKLALKGGPKEVTDKILSSMSERGAAMFKEDLDIMSEPSKAAAEGVQRTIIQKIKELERNGRIKIAK